MVWWRASLVGGNFSDVAWFFLNSNHLSSATVLTREFEQYSRQTNICTRRKFSSGTLCLQPKLFRALKISSLAFSNAFQHVTFLFSANEPVISAPENAVQEEHYISVGQAYHIQFEVISISYLRPFRWQKTALTQLGVTPYCKNKVINIRGSIYQLCSYWSSGIFSTK